MGVMTSASAKDGRSFFTKPLYFFSTGLRGSDLLGPGPGAGVRFSTIRAASRTPPVPGARVRSSNLCASQVRETQNESVSYKFCFVDTRGGGCPRTDRYDASTRHGVQGRRSHVFLFYFPPFFFRVRPARASGPRRINHRVPAVSLYEHIILRRLVFSRRRIYTRAATPYEFPFIIL